MNKNVEIILKTNNETSAEYRGAFLIKEYLRNTLPESALGKITILTNVTLLGQKVKDLDIIIIGMINNCTVDAVFADGDQSEMKNPVKVYNFCIALEVKAHSFGYTGYLSE